MVQWIRAKCKNARLSAPRIFTVSLFWTMFINQTIFVSCWMMMRTESSNNEFNRYNEISSSKATNRRAFVFGTGGVIGTMIAGQSSIDYAYAAPPIAVIAEELGYFPVRSPSTGEIMYIPKRIQRESTDQAIQLAKYMNEKQIGMAGTYWCPHTSRQKELFGRTAWENDNYAIRYIECAPKGYNANPNFCFKQQIDGYPTWISLKTGKVIISGERSLVELAQAVGYPGTIDTSLEDINAPPMIGSSAACKQPGQK